MHLPDGILSGHAEVIGAVAAGGGLAVAVALAGVVAVALLSGGLRGAEHLVRVRTDR